MEIFGEKKQTELYGMKVAHGVLTSFSSIVYDDTVPICQTFLLSDYFRCVKKLAQNLSMPWFSLRTQDTAIRFMMQCFAD